MKNSVTKDYRKATDREISEIINSEKKIAKSLNIADRVEVMPKSESYVQFKDHKEDFINKQQCRLINTNKSNLGKVSKEILQRTNDNLRAKLKVNHWQSTADVITWFCGLENKERSTFIKFDIDQFYPSITQELLRKSIEWAETLVEITDEEKHIIYSTKQNILYWNGKPWVKKGDSKCDVTMGSWDGAETSDLVGLYILFQLKYLDINLGLYRDDGLGVLTKRPQQVEIIKKNLCEIFRKKWAKNIS